MGTHLGPQTRGVTVRLTEAAYWGYRTFAHNSEIPTSALLEAVGRVFGDRDRWYAWDTRPPPVMGAVLRRARTADHERRRRPEGRTPPTRQINTKLTEAAHEGLDAFCAHYGLTMAGLLEALGLTLADEEILQAFVASPPPAVAAVLSLAREITSSRRKRKR